VSCMMGGLGACPSVATASFMALTMMDHFLFPFHICSVVLCQYYNFISRFLNFFLGKIKEQRK
jgi:hypothetical protein